MLNESDIQKLLRLKRYEQPPQEYFNTFLHDFHRRQRAELLRQPAWKIALERIQAFFSEHSLGRYAYSTATAVVLFFAGITSFNILNVGSQVAKTDSTAPTISTPAPLVSGEGLASAQHQADELHPRYVIDTRPASYERSFSF